MCCRRRAGILPRPMDRTPTRCGYCGRRTVTRAGRCPSCGQEKRPPKTIEPPPPPSVWREVRSQIAAAAATVLLIVAAIAIGSSFLLFVGLLVLCAIAVIAVVAHGTS